MVTVKARQYILLVNKFKKALLVNGLEKTCTLGHQIPHNLNTKDVLYKKGCQGVNVEGMLEQAS